MLLLFLLLCAGAPSVSANTNSTTLPPSAQPTTPATPVPITCADFTHDTRFALPPQPLQVVQGAVVPGVCCVVCGEHESCTAWQHDSTNARCHLFDQVPAHNASMAMGYSVGMQPSTYDAVLSLDDMSLLRCEGNDHLVSVPSVEPFDMGIVTQTECYQSLDGLGEGIAVFSFWKDRCFAWPLPSGSNSTDVLYIPYPRGAGCAKDLAALPECTCSAFELSRFCYSKCNTRQCGYGGGNCCEETCNNANGRTCGETDFSQCIEYAKPYSILSVGDNHVIIANHTASAQLFYRIMPESLLPAHIANASLPWLDGRLRPYTHPVPVPPGQWTVLGRSYDVASRNATDHSLSVSQPVLFDLALEFTTKGPVLPLWLDVELNGVYNSWAYSLVKAVRLDKRDPQPTSYTTSRYFFADSRDGSDVYHFQLDVEDMPLLANKWLHQVQWDLTLSIANRSMPWMTTVDAAWVKLTYLDSENSSNDTTLLLRPSPAVPLQCWSALDGCPIVSPTYSGYPILLGADSLTLSLAPGASCNTTQQHLCELENSCREQTCADMTCLNAYRTHMSTSLRNVDQSCSEYPLPFHVPEFTEYDVSFTLDATLQDVQELAYYRHLEVFVSLWAPHRSFNGGRADVQQVTTAVPTTEEELARGIRVQFRANATDLLAPAPSATYNSTLSHVVIRVFINPDDPIDSQLPFPFYLRDVVVDVPQHSRRFAVVGQGQEMHGNVLAMTESGSKGFVQPHTLFPLREVPLSPPHCNGVDLQPGHLVRFTNDSDPLLVVQGRPAIMSLPHTGTWGQFLCYSYAGHVNARSLGVCWNKQSSLLLPQEFDLPAVLLEDDNYDRCQSAVPVHERCSSAQTLLFVSCGSLEHDATRPHTLQPTAHPTTAAATTIAPTIFYYDGEVSSSDGATYARTWLQLDVSFNVTWWDNATTVSVFQGDLLKVTIAMSDLLSFTPQQPHSSLRLPLSITTFTIPDVNYTVMLANPSGGSMFEGFEWDDTTMHYRVLPPYTLRLPAAPRAAFFQDHVFQVDTPLPSGATTRDVEVSLFFSPDAPADIIDRPVQVTLELSRVLAMPEESIQVDMSWLQATPSPQVQQTGGQTAEASTVFTAADDTRTPEVLVQELRDMLVVGMLAQDPSLTYLRFLSAVGLPQPFYPPVEPTPSGESSALLWYGIVAGCTLIVVIALSLLVNKFFPNMRIAPLLTLIISLFDFITDTVFAVSLISEKDEFGGLLIASFCFLAIPFVINLAVLIHVFRLEFREEMFRTYFAQHQGTATAVLILSAPNVDSLQFLSSGFLGLRAFMAPFKQAQLTLYGLISNALEDAPQIIIQSIYLAQSGSSNEAAIVSLATSALSLLYGVLKRILFRYMYTMHQSDTLQVPHTSATPYTTKTGSDNVLLNAPGQLINTSAEGIEDNYSDSEDLNTTVAQPHVLGEPDGVEGGDTGTATGAGEGHAYNDTRVSVSSSGSSQSTRSSFSDTPSVSMTTGGGAGRRAGVNVEMQDI